MRNDTPKWAAPLGEHRTDVLGENARLRLHQPPRQTLLSGPFSQCLALAQQATALGWPDVAGGESYAIRLRRDRMISVNGPQLHDGWHPAQGVAVSDMTGGYVVFELSGPRALHILKTGTELDINLPSASAMRQFHRHEVFLYRWQAADTFRLHAQRGQLESIWHLLGKLVTVEN